MRKLLLLFFLLTLKTTVLLGQGQPFYVCTDNQQLLKLDISTCDTTFIALTAAAIFDIAITPDNRLYGITGSSFFEINTTTGAMTTIAIFPNVSCNSLVSDSAGNLFTVDNDSLYQINRFTGQIFSLGFYGQYASAGDLTFYNDALYLSAANDQLVKIILQPTLSSQLIGTMQATNIFGINTICLNNTPTMIATGGDNYFSSLYRVNPSNAALTLLCDSIVHTLIFGATSQQDFSASKHCFVAGLNTPASPVELNLFPNPAGNELVVRSSESGDKIEQIETYNVLGELIFTQPQTTNYKEQTIDVSQLSSGIYIVRIKTSKGFHITKFIKE